MKQEIRYKTLDEVIEVTGLKKEDFIINGKEPTKVEYLGDGCYFVE